MDAFKKGWYTDIGGGGPETGEALSLEVEKVLFHEKSKYQDILVFQSKNHGRVLALDNALQLSERDEFAYQEMITFLPLNCHPNPKKVLIIGGGDGGVVREVVKNPEVESVTLCEIDEKVIEVSKKFLPFMAKGFNSPKLTVNIGDGTEFVKKNRGEFDVIITDSPDPIGPAVHLFEKAYYETLKLALRPGGIICSQAETFWLHLNLVKEMVEMCRKLFPVVEYASSYVCTYPAGQIGYLLCGLSPDTNFREPVRKFSADTSQKYSLKYYSYDAHSGAFVMPLFVAKALKLPDYGKKDEKLS